MVGKFHIILCVLVAAAFTGRVQAKSSEPGATPEPSGVNRPKELKRSHAILGSTTDSASPDSGERKPPEKSSLHGFWKRNGGAIPGSSEFDNVRQAVNALTPEQRKQFRENLLHWMNLPPEQKRSLSDRENFRKKRITEATNNAYEVSGLQLNPEQRAQFDKRYSEERRKIEEQLRKEAEEKRQPRVAEAIEKLRVEFSATSEKAAPVAPAAQPPTQVPTPGGP